MVRPDDSHLPPVALVFIIIIVPTLSVKINKKPTVFVISASPSIYFFSGLYKTLQISPPERQWSSTSTPYREGRWE